MTRFLITAVLLAAAAACATAQLQTRFRGFSGGLPDHGGGRQSSRRTSGGSGTRSGSAKASCSALATADAYAGSLDGYTSAVADLVADVCDPAWDGSLVSLQEEMADVAAAWARATVKAAASCVTEVSGGGRANGCAYSESTAYAFEVAAAAAHAEATAHAFASCSCDNAAAWTFGDAAVVKTLIADVYAAAAAAVCATGNQVSEAEAAVDCAARVFVDVYSKAAAEAAVNADCVSFSDTAIYADVATAVSAEVTWTEFCDASDAVRGSADVETYGDSYADAYDN